MVRAPLRVVANRQTHFPFTRTPRFGTIPPMTPADTPGSAPRRVRWMRWVALGVLGVLLAAVGWEGFRVYGGLNEHAVIPGKVYRTSQPSEKDINALTTKHGIRTVLNLRGSNPWDDWYKDECRATHAAGVSQEDVTLSAYTLPYPAELKRVVEVLDRSEKPVLVHCKQGADRTGLVSVMALLLYTDASVSEARRQLLPNYGHWPITRTLNIDRFFDLYEANLRQVSDSHTPDRFRHWVLNEYCPGPARSELSWAIPPPATLKTDSAFTAAVLCVNRSDTDWQLKPTSFAGVHLWYAVYDEKSQTVADGRTGLRSLTVPPGGTVTVPVPLPILKPGKYLLLAELHDGTAAAIPFRTQSFTKFGDESLVTEFEVR